MSSRFSAVRSNFHKNPFGMTMRLLAAVVLCVLWGYSVAPISKYIDQLKQGPKTPVTASSAAQTTPGSIKP